MLRTLRITLAALCFILLTLLFLDFTGTLHGWFGWMAKIQFMPALLAVNVGIIVGLLALTLLFGRVYCSVICPLGVFQDVISWFASKRKKNRFAYSPALAWLRYTVLAVYAAAIALGISSFVALLDPYGAYGRIASSFLAPVYQWSNNLLAYLSERMGNYAFYPVEVTGTGLIVIAIAAITLVAVVLLAWRGGRTYCNTICPVGTLLGFVSRFSIFKPLIDIEKCNGCKLCSRNCKASCINADEHRIDYSRCVACMDCIGKCKQGAIKFKPCLFTQAVKPSEVETADSKGVNRRGFVSIATGLALAGAAKAQQQLQGDGGLADIIDKEAPERKTPVAPPGSISTRNMTKHCTGCQLCVAVCDNHVLRAAGGLLTLMQPVMSYEAGYCRPECVKCSTVCPTGAIKPLTTADKSATKIGTAKWSKELCTVNVDKQPCDNCARHCPTQAITMIANPEAPAQATPQPGAFFGRRPKPLLIPMIDEEKCIGCGACEHLCPARPLSAIVVEGILMHRTV
ncbi:MAG: 4Fe-4S binding protein [Tannerella sp.]|jgi:polyferredoxin|nr:4Fe-4S binding protein [Tannerella sp.]